MSNNLAKVNAKLVIELMDLTSLNLEDNEQKIINLCQSANNPQATPAALCVYPKFIQSARKQLDLLGLNSVKIATVTNFPSGEASLDEVTQQNKQALDLGADEVDVVFPYKKFIQGDWQSGAKIILSSADLCHSYGKKLKVILETGELKTDDLIYNASLLAIDNGADFIKTSTGKVTTNATLTAAKIMLKAIKDRQDSSQKVGFKAAGGVKTLSEALLYIDLAREIMQDEKWVNPNNFRFGASSLLADLLPFLV